MIPTDVIQRTEPSAPARCRREFRRAAARVASRDVDRAASTWVPVEPRDSSGCGGGGRGRPRPASTALLVEQLAGCGGRGQLAAVAPGAAAVEQIGPVRGPLWPCSRNWTCGPTYRGRDRDGRADGVAPSEFSVRCPNHEQSPPPRDIACAGRRIANNAPVAGDDHLIESASGCNKRPIRRHAARRPIHKGSPRDDAT